MRTVAVCGSCITRDNFNARFNEDHRRWYDVVLAANQSSMIAMMSPPVEPELTDADPLGDYDAWNVRSDLSREFLAGVVEAQPDFLLLDFFGDVHFGVLRLDDGRYVTDNRWKLWRTAQYADWVATGRVTRVRPLEDPDAYLELWIEAMDRFDAFIRTNCPNTQVILHCGFNTNKIVVGDRPGWMPMRKGARLAPFDVPAGNALWKRLDAHALEAYGWARIDLRDERYSSTDKHPWGPFWVHYTPDYYHRFLAELHAQDVATRVTPEQRGLIEEAAAACRSQLAEQAAGLDEVVAAGQERIRVLESRGILQAVRGRRPPPEDLAVPDGTGIEHAARVVADLEPGLEPDDREQLRTIAASGRERAAAQTERWTPVLARQQARAEELAGLGAARAVKFAIGQRIRKTRARWQKPAAEKESR
nr:DUF6270 domain-containing protein [Nocardioides marmoriginsengisoli]